jgi:two-component system, response regulator, stage 0 sporulation protein F
MVFLVKDSRAPILVVDDEPDARELLRALLESAGHPVLEANNGQEALRLLTAVDAPEPRAIVLDLNMPIMTGWEFLGILGSYHRLSRIPVLVISGELHREALAHSTIAHWLPKPISADGLLAKVAILTADRQSS